MLAVLIIGGGAVLLLRQGSAEDRNGPVDPAKAGPPTDTTLPAFVAPTVQGAETHPLEPVPDAPLPGAEEPIVAGAGDPTGGLSGQGRGQEPPAGRGREALVFRGNALLGTAAFPGSRRVIESTATSAADGRFELKRIPVGQPYVIVARTTTSRAAKSAGLRVAKDVVAPDVTLIMSDGAVIMGMVSAKGRAGPIANARVELFYQLDNAWLKPEEQRPYKVVFSDATGRFAFTHVSSSSIRVRVQADGFESQSRTISSALDSEPHDQTVSSSWVRATRCRARPSRTTARRCPPCASRPTR